MLHNEKATDKAAASMKDRPGKSLGKLRAAIDRIVQLTPTSPELTARLRRKKKLRLSVASVAVEAGMSRTAIYGLYPEIVQEIVSRKKGAPAAKLSAAEQTEIDLREENRLLQQSVIDLLSENATLLFRLSAADDRVKRLKERLMREEDRRKSRSVR